MSRRLRGASALAVGLALLVGCGGDDDDAASGTDTTESGDETTTTGDETTTTGDQTTTTGDDDSGAAGGCHLTSEEVSAIVGSTVEEQVDLRTGSDCQYTGEGGVHVVLGVRTAGASPDEYIAGNEEFFGPAEELEGVGDQAAIFEDGSVLAFVDGQVISVLGAPTPDAASALALAVIAGL